MAKLRIEAKILTATQLNSKLVFRKAGVIQWPECQLPKLDVAGSNPVSRSFLCPIRAFIF